MTDVSLQLEGALTIAGINAGFEVDLRIAGGPVSLTLRPTQPLSLADLWSTIRSQVHQAFGVSLPALDDGPWKKLLATDVMPSVFITPTKQNGVSIYLDLDFQPPISVGGSSSWGPVTVEIEPNLTIHALMIGYDATNGLNLSARVSYPTQKGGNAVAAGSRASGQITKVVDYPFPLPAQGSSNSFQVHYLGLGQRVGPQVGSISPGTLDPLAAIFDELERNFDTNDPEEVLTRLANTFYQPDRGWFIAADVEYKGFRLRVLFNDPAMYGLEVTVGRVPPNFFSGLLFEILYQKLGPNLGLYYGALTLPDTMRRIPLEGFILILPGFSLWVYTNGDFRLNIGWPVGPNSIGVSVELLTGWAGFYVAKLSSADNPGAQSSNNFDPILAFGIGFSLVAGISFNAGPLSASLSATATTTMQGLLAWKAGAGSMGGPPDAYWFAGTFSLQVLIQGSVDFYVIKASLTISFGFQAQVAFENGYKTLIAIAAHVSVSASIKVLFFRISFSFSTEIHYTFTIGSGSQVASVDGPLESGLVGLGADAVVDLLEAHVALAMHLRDTMAPALRAWDEILQPPPRLASQRRAERFAQRRNTTALLPRIDVHFVLHPTVVYGGSTPVVNVVALLVTDSPPTTKPSPASPQSGTGFESLLARLVCWLINDYAPPGSPNERLSDRLRVLKQLLGQGQEPPGPPFDTVMGFAAATKAFFSDNLHFRIVGTDATMASQPESLATFLPMFDVLALSVGGVSIDFALVHPTPANYSQAVSCYFEGLGLFGSAPPSETSARLDMASPPTGPSVASIVFADYFLMLMRKTINDLLDAALAYEKKASASLHASATGTAQPPVAALGAYIAALDPQNELSILLEQYDYAATAGFASRFLLGGLQLPVPADVPAVVTPQIARTLPTEPMYVLTGQQVPITSVGSPPIVTGTLGYHAGGPTDWVVFANGTNATASVGVTASPPSAPAPLWAGLTAAHAAATGDGTIAYSALPSLVPVELVYTTRSQRLWKPATGGNKVAIAFPGPLLALIAARSAASPSLPDVVALTLQAGAPAAPGAAQLRDSTGHAGTAALLFSLPITQVQSATPTDLGGSPGHSPIDSSPPGSGTLPFLYQIGATDDASREHIYQAMHGGARILGVSLLYTDADGNGLTSDLMAPDVLLVRTNLSTENQARDVTLRLGARLAASPGGVDFALLTDPLNFLLLIWEVSVVNAAGYYLYYRTQGGEGLPQRLFQDTAPKTGQSGTAPVPESSGYAGSLTVVVEFAPAQAQTVPVPPAANTVLADASAFSGKATRLGVLDPAGVPLTSYYSGYQPGDLGFKLEWTGRDSKPSPAEIIPVGELYQLIQFTVFDPDASPNAPVAWSLPLNPMAPNGGTGSPASPSSPDPATSEFQQIFPAYRFLIPGDPPQPSPVASPGGGNWYDLVGRSVTLDFRLCDIFGNALPQAAQTAQTGVYHDPIIHPGLYPFVQTDHVFQAGHGGTATLAIGLRFDTTALSDLGGSPVSPGNSQTSRLLALQARYTDIAFQLADPGTSYSLATSLALPPTLPADPRPVLAGFVAEIASAIAAAMDPHAVLPPPITATLQVPVSVAAAAALPANVGVVTVSLNAQRDPARAAPGAAVKMPDVVTNSFQVPPQQGSSLFGSPEDKKGIAAYAMSFEAAFNNFDGAGGALKIAQRSGVVANDSAQQSATLWYVRFGGDQASPVTGGIRTAFTGAMTYYALRPLNTTPRSQTVGTTIYSDIDMDVWAAAFFSAADTLFEPQLATAIALLDERGATDHFKRLREAKETLAKVVPSGLALVLDGDKAGSIVDAREALRQSMLEKLANAVTVSVVAQAEAKLSVIGRADDSSPPHARPPELFGRIGIPNGVSLRHLISSPATPATNVYTISPARLNVANGTQWASLLVSVAQPDQHVNLVLPLDYEISYMQHDFETDEMQDGYVPSSWLKFALPGVAPLLLPVTAQPSNPDGVAIVPIPLPYEPAAPALLAQRSFGSGTHASPASPIDLSALITSTLQWSYQVEQTASLAAQDTLYFDLTFNGGAALEGLEAAADPLAPLFSALADFRTGYPAFQKAIPAILAEAYKPTSPHRSGSPDSPTAALESIVADIGAIARAWPDRSLGLVAADLTESPPGLIHYRLRLLPGQRDQITVTLEARTPTAQNPDVWPALRSADGLLNWTPDRTLAKQTADNWWQLSTTVASTARLTDLTFTWAPLTLGTRQSAAYKCWVLRNAELVEGRTTNTAFVYQTSTVRFSAPEVPLIIAGNLPVVPATQPLETMLDEILVPLGPQNSALSPVLNFRVDYSFAVATPPGGGLPLLADTPLLAVDDLNMNSSLASPGIIAADLARAIKRWRKGFHGKLTQGYLTLSLTLFGTVMDQQLPLVQIDPLRIDVSHVPPSWWD